MNPKCGVLVDDQLYGAMLFSSDEAKLFEAAEMKRLKRVAMSIPSWYFSFYHCASRWEHSLGVAYLARWVADHCPGFAHLRASLYCAGLAHDMGTPPFSHASDPAMLQVLGIDHERLALQMLSDSEFGRLAKEAGACLEQIKELLMGAYFQGGPDLDDLDNTPRFGQGLRCYLLDHDPRRDIARFYQMVEGQLCLREGAEPGVAKWSACRRKVYDYVYSQAVNASFHMLSRAVSLMAAAGKLPASFFTMTDEEAIIFLQRHGDSAVQALLARLERREYHARVVQLEVTKSLAQCLDPQSLADAAAQELKLSPGAVCIGLNRRSGNKARSIPTVGADGRISVLPMDGQPKLWLVNVFVDPENKTIAPRLEEFVNRKLNYTLYGMPAKVS